MADFPALPIWTDAYLADCGHLTDAEHGRYLMLLMLIWRSPDCRIPNDNAWIARKMRRTVEDVQAEVRPIIAEFCQCDGNWIMQKRLSKEMLFVKKNAKRQSDAAKSRWNKEKGACHGNAQSGNAPTPTPTPLIQKEEGSKDPSKKESRASRIPEGAVLPDDYRTFAEQEGHPDPEREWSKFTDYWRAQPGAKGLKLDWLGTWRNWVRRSVEDGKRKQQWKQPGSAEFRNGFAAILAGQA